MYIHICMYIRVCVCVCLNIHFKTQNTLVNSTKHIYVNYVTMPRNKMDRQGRPVYFPTFPLEVSIVVHMMHKWFTVNLMAVAAGWMC